MYTNNLTMEQFMKGAETIAAQHLQDSQMVIYASSKFQESLNQSMKEQFLKAYPMTPKEMYKQVFITNQHTSNKHNIYVSV